MEDTLALKPAILVLKPRVSLMVWLWVNVLISTSELPFVVPDGYLSERWWSLNEIIKCHTPCLIGAQQILTINIPESGLGGLRSGLCKSLEKVGREPVCVGEIDLAYLTGLLFMRVGRNFSSSGEIKKQKRARFSLSRVETDVFLLAGGKGWPQKNFGNEGNQLVEWHCSFHVVITKGRWREVLADKVQEIPGVTVWSAGTGVPVSGARKVGDHWENTRAPASLHRHWFAFWLKKKQHEGAETTLKTDSRTVSTTWTDAETATFQPANQTGDAWKGLSLRASTSININNRFHLGSSSTLRRGEKSKKEDLCPLSSCWVSRTSRWGPTEDSSLWASRGFTCWWGTQKKEQLEEQTFPILWCCLVSMWLSIIKDNGLKDHIIKLKRQVIICYTISL